MTDSSQEITECTRCGSVLGDNPRWCSDCWMKKYQEIQEGDSSSSHPQSEVSASNCGGLSEVKNAGGGEPPKPDAWLVKHNRKGKLSSYERAAVNLANYRSYEGPIDGKRPLYSASTIGQNVKEKSKNLIGLCTDHDRWIYDKHHKCIKSKSCDIWKPKNGHIWADFLENEVFSVD